jgi:hypothetical protein
MENDMRVRWAEIRNDDNDRGHLELYYILAEQISTEWTFYERSSWELRWYPIPSTKWIGRTKKSSSFES